MRFRELRLVAFGPFTNQVIDFGEPTGSDLHVVLGLNEAGKSTALRAIHALLFGFPHVTPDAHIHPYDRLRVGALLDTNDGRSLEVARVKARQRDLRDVNDDPLEDDLLRNALGGIDQGLYDRLFLVDHRELRDGGAGLLAGGGEFGVSLFGATLGAGNLAAIRGALQKRSEDLFKPDTKARKPLLNAALRGYRDHMEQTRGLSVKPREYEAAATRVGELARERREKASDLATLERDERALQRLASVTGPLARRQSVVGELDALADVPVLVRDATTRREVAAEGRARSSGKLTDETATLARLNDELAGVVVPQQLIERAAEIQALTGDIAMHEKALRDRDNRSHELEAQKKASAELRSQLGSSAPSRAAPVDRALRTSIEKLGEDQATLRERELVARAHLQASEEANDDAARALRGSPGPPDAPDAIKRWTAAVTKCLPIALAAATQKGAVERGVTRLSASGAASSPSIDPLTPLPAQPPSGDVIEVVRADLAVLSAEQAEKRADHAHLAHQRNQLRIQLAALGAGEVAQAREQMLDARTERDLRYVGVGEFLDAADLGGARGAHKDLGATLDD